jgi:cyclophilin family peptidyl-prolyl cis-trans isomerase
VDVRIQAANALAELTGKRPKAKWVSGKGQAAKPEQWEVKLTTDRGPIRILLDGHAAPNTAANLVALARKGYFNGLTFHRVVPDFVVQGGDPRGTGEGGPGYSIRCEINERPYERGTIGMALSGKDTGGSQFFVALSPQPHLDGRYTSFGKVVEGMDVIDRLLEGDRITEATAAPAPKP